MPKILFYAVILLAVLAGPGWLIDPEFSRADIVAWGALAAFLLLAGMFVFFARRRLLRLYRSESELVEARNRQRKLSKTNLLLDRLNEMRAQLMANISHEMKTPLTVMSTHAQLAKALLSSGAGREEIMRSLDTITAESARLARMVSGVLDLGGRRESPGGMVEVDMATLLGTTVEVYRSIFAKRGNVAIVSVASDLPPVRGSVDMLTQVMFNLFANANLHTENGTVSVSAQRRDDMVGVVVGDTGAGIPAELLPRVFERRVRGRDEGAGLGLAICRSIVERHDGTIEIRNAAGGGTEVCFFLPGIGGDRL